MSRCKRPRLSSSGREARIKQKTNVRREKHIKAADEAMYNFVLAIEVAEAAEMLTAIDEDREPRELFICPDCGKMCFNAVQEKKNGKSAV